MNFLIVYKLSFWTILLVSMPIRSFTVWSLPIISQSIANFDRQSLKAANLFHFPWVNFNISCPSTILPFFLMPSCSCIIKNDLRWHESCLFTLRWAMIKSVWILCPSSSSSSSTAPWILLWLKWSWPRVCHGIAWFPVPRLSSLLPRQRWSSCYSWRHLPSSSMLGNR